MSIGDGVRPNPTCDFAEARGAFDALAARDGPEIAATGRSQLYEHGRRTPRAIVLLHGLTNAPEQWRSFAQSLHANGDTVIAPRFPGHGYADRDTREIARARANDYLAVASEAVDIACGAGERVTLAGLSVGGAMAAWLALSRDDIAHAVATVPFVGIANFGARANALVAKIFDALPAVFVPWDPSGKNAQIPPYAYAKFPTRALAACLDIGLDALERARSRAIAGRIDFTLNAREPACNNALARALADRIGALRPDGARTTVWSDLPAIHDIVDPTNPQGRTDLVYPRLRAIIDA